MPNAECRPLPVFRRPASPSVFRAMHPSRFPCNSFRASDPRMCAGRIANEVPRRLSIPEIPGPAEHCPAAALDSGDSGSGRTLSGGGSPAGASGRPRSLHKGTGPEADSEMGASTGPGDGGSAGRIGDPACRPIAQWQRPDIGPDLPGFKPSHCRPGLMMGAGPEDDVLCGCRHPAAAPWVRQGQPVVRGAVPAGVVPERGLQGPAG